MDSSPTLQDFVLNLIYDPSARSAFEVDPHGSLQQAGLGDVTAADVQDVLPLVLDFAPLSGLTTTDPVAQVDSLTMGVANLDIAGAAAHLQSITAQLGGNTSHFTGDLNVAAAGAVTVSVDHLISGALDNGLVLHDGGLFGHTGLGVTGAGGLVSDVTGAAGLTADYDPGTGLDAGADVDLHAGVTAPVQQTVTDVTYGADGLVSHLTPGLTGSLDGTISAVTGITGSIGVGGAHDLDVSGVHGATSSIVGSVIGSDPAGGLLPDGTGVAGVDSTVSGIEHSVSGVVGGVTGAVEPDHGHGLLGGLTGLDF
ncbi:IniB N-terminal domain-containing protein [Paractinoplanes toevensis]|uniref:Uncharacterized protein n=1 Tax=Paractinoplanes toevensis TaxID=571911 RepID=A0A920BR81_9ACTN|nr:IniB N-terminal domain-containing protein [Actinoplanes toevensis]GIM97381.1 hypothetical protein Ato02nite_091740 [Actinoplanes toevensis]